MNVSALFQRILGIAAAAALTALCLNIFNPFPVIFEMIALLFRPLGMLLPHNWEFVPVVTALAALNILLAVLIRRATVASAPIFALWLFRSSIVTVILGVGYITMIMWALGRMDG